MPHLAILLRRLPAAAACVLAALAAAGLGACSTAPVHQARDPLAVLDVAPVAPADDLPLALLAAQFALQENDLAGAARGFVAASRLSPDAGLAADATRLALSVGEWQLAGEALTRWQELAPADPGIGQARAWIALGEGHLDEAGERLDALAGSGSPDAWRLVAQVLLNGKDKAAAARLLEHVATPAHLGDSEANWVAVSQLAFKLGDKALAQRLAARALERFHSPPAYAWSARLAQDRRDMAGARATWQEGLQRHPRDAALRSGYAALLALEGDNAGAARVLAQGPQDDATWAARAAYSARADDKAALAALYRELADAPTPRSGTRLYLLGQVAEMLERPADALDWYRAVPDDDSHGFDARMRMAVALDRLGKREQATTLMNRLVEQAAGDREQQGLVYLLQAELLVRGKKPREAMAVYDRALGNLPDDRRLLYARALLAVDQGNQAAGERDLRRILELAPDDAEALNALGYTLADGSRRGDPAQEEALRLIGRALELKPDEPAIVDSMGWLQYRMGNLDQALADLRRAYASEPDPDIAAHLGEVLWVRGEHDEARRIWDAARSKAPDNKTLIEAIRRLTP